MIRTFGLGPRAPKGILSRLEWNPSAENLGKSQGKCENNASEKMSVFGRFWVHG